MVKSDQREGRWPVGESDSSLLRVVPFDFYVCVHTNRIVDFPHIRRARRARVLHVHTPQLDRAMAMTSRTNTGTSPSDDALPPSLGSARI